MCVELDNENGERVNDINFRAATRSATVKKVEVKDGTRWRTPIQITKLEKENTKLREQHGKTLLSNGTPNIDLRSKKHQT